MNPSPSRSIPIIGGGDSAAAIRRASTLCDGWVNTGAVSPDEALSQVARIREAVEQAGRSEEPFSVYVAVRAAPNLDLYRRLEDAGITDLLCAPWMAVPTGEGDLPDAVKSARLAACEGFAEHFIAKMG
jgi:alkanesulfonate monooxygenase SsuD/methylene tetrahydromethanopterin reductase-like flavin-dependent oxidoreductase (luciferase family)